MSLHRYALLGTASESFTANDAGVGVDAGVVGVAAADGGTEAAVAMAPLAIESGTATESLIRPITLEDTASFDDLYAFPPVALQANTTTDSGTFTEDAGHTVVRAETGTRTEAVTLVVVLAATDSGTAAEYGGQNWSLTDSAVGTELAQAPWAGETGSAAEVIDRELPLTDSGTGTDAQGERSIELFDDAILYEDVFDLSLTLFDDGLAFDEAVWGQVAGDSGTAAEVALGGRLAFDDYVATEDLTLTAAVEGADAGTGVDEVPLGVVGSGLLATDSGSGGDAGTLETLVTSTDSGSLTETAVPEWGYDEAVAAVETPSVAADVSGEDADGVSGETGTVVASVSTTDSGALGETGVADGAMTATDSGTAVAETATPEFLLEEAGSVVEAGTPDAEFSATDGGTPEAEAGTPAATYATTDAGSLSAEVGTLDAGLTAPDAVSSGVETLTPHFAPDEVGTFADSLSLVLSEVESGTGSESATAPFAGDAGTFAEEILYGPSIDDAGVGVDAVDAVAVACEDGGAGGELGLMGLASDSGTGTDSMWVDATAVEAGTGTDAGVPVAETTPALDASESGTDVGTLSVVIPPSPDSGTLSEAVSIVTANTADADAAVGSEAGELEAVNDESPPDEGVGIDEVTIEAVFSTTDDESGGSENAFWLPQGAYTAPVPLKDTDLDQELAILG